MRYLYGLTDRLAQKGLGIMRKIMVMGILAAMAAGLVACANTDVLNPSAMKNESDGAMPSADERLLAMSDLLAAVSTFRIQTRERHEWVGTSGDWSRIEGTTQATIWRPDFMHLKMRGSDPEVFDRELYYNGWTLAFENHAKKVWAWANVPETIDAMLDEVAWRYDLPIPVSDMLYSSPYNALMTDDTQSRFVGREIIEGRQCDHFAFSQPQIDWDIWIATEGKPLPCRLDIIHKGVQGPPRSQIVFAAIVLGIEVDKTLFAFEPQKDYSEIPVVENPPPE